MAQPDNMNIIITGASKGIGKAIAEIFAANGHHLFICSRNEVTLYKTMEELLTKYPDVKIKAKARDLSVKEQAIEFGKWVLDNGIVPDILINNAGTFVPGGIANEEAGALDTMLQTNLYSAYHVTRTILPVMIKQKKGHIFNVCSIASLNAYKDGGAYGISKFALYGFSKNLREEMKAHNIKVTAVHPGAVLTDSWGNFDNSSNRIMEASDIAKMIYAASQLSAGACAEDIIIRPQLGDL